MIHLHLPSVVGFSADVLAAGRALWPYLVIPPAVAVVSTALSLVAGARNE